jgi:hypothetical protein
MLKHFSRYTPGWWVLHAAALGLMYLLGSFVEFRF